MFDVECRAILEEKNVTRVAGHAAAWDSAEKNGAWMKQSARKLNCYVVLKIHGSSITNAFHNGSVLLAEVCKDKDGIVLNRRT